jgi:MFS family permease
LATVGLATFWGTHIYGKNVMLEAAKERYVQAEVEATGEEATPAMRAAILEAESVPLKRWEMLGMFLVTTGGGIGLVAFGPICQRIGRRKAFLFYHIGGLASALLLFQVIQSFGVILVFLPIFGFLTLGMHAGYAIYFPELYPTRVRGTGAGFCFNGGRILAAPALFISGWMQDDWGFSLENAASILSLLFLFGALVLLLAPETKDQELPE